MVIDIDKVECTQEVAICSGEWASTRQSGEVGGMEKFAADLIFTPGPGSRYWRSVSQNKQLWNMWEGGGDPEPGSGEINKKDYHSLSQLSGVFSGCDPGMGRMVLAQLNVNLRVWMHLMPGNKNRGHFMKVCSRESFLVKILHSKIETN